MISVSRETLLPLADVPARLPKRPSGKKLHISAVYRWIRSGISGVVLEAVKIGGTTYTSLEALQRFAERCSGQPVQQSATRSRASAAQVKLDHLLGICRRTPAT